MTIEEVLKYIADWVKTKRTGNIQINFFRGGISNINLTQCIKTDKDGGCNGEKEKAIKFLR